MPYWKSRDFVATVSANGKPNLSPKGTFVVIDNTAIAFAAIRSPGAPANLVERPEVEVNCVDPLTRRGFRLKGRAMLAPRDSDIYQQHLGRFASWPGLLKRIRHIVLIHVEEMSLPTSPVYDDGASMKELRRYWQEKLCRTD